MSLLYGRKMGVGEPIICLHGLLGSSDNLGMIARVLAEQYEVHSLDLRNHGRSFHSDRIDYDVMSADVLHYAQAHHFKKVILIGHSMGGKVAMALALRMPQLIAKMVVLDMAPVSYPATHEAIFNGLRAIENQRPKTRQEANTLLSRFVSHRDTRAFLLKNIRLDKDKNNYQLRIYLNAIEKHYPELLQFNLPDTQPSTVPTLFLAGEDSPYCVASYEAAIHQLFLNAHIQRIPNTGHWLHAQATDTVNQNILRYLNAL